MFGLALAGPRLRSSPPCFRRMKAVEVARGIEQIAGLFAGCPTVRPQHPAIFASGAGCGQVVHVLREILRHDVIRPAERGHDHHRARRIRHLQKPAPCLRRAFVVVVFWIHLEIDIQRGSARRVFIFGDAESGSGARGIERGTAGVGLPEIGEDFPASTRVHRCQSPSGCFVAGGHGNHPTRQSLRCRVGGHSRVPSRPSPWRGCQRPKRSRWRPVPTRWSG